MKKQLNKKVKFSNITIKQLITETKTATTECNITIYYNMYTTKNYTVHEYCYVMQKKCYAITDRSGTLGNLVLLYSRSCNAVSYTHLDVYKRQVLTYKIVYNNQYFGVFRSI